MDIFGKIWMIGTERQLLEACYFGVVEVVQINSSVISSVVPIFSLLDLPYVFVNDEHLKELEEWRDKYQQSNQQRESSIDAIARGMSELAAVSNAPLGAATGMTETPLPMPRSARQAGATPAAGAAGAAQQMPLVSIAEEVMAKCTNCKTCYQDLSELFEKTTIVVEGKAMEVSRVIPGALDKIQLTPELIAKASRIADDCDAEIITFNQPQ